MEVGRCYGCMRELRVPGGVCPHCAYDNTRDPGTQQEYMLRCGTVLNGRYLVGRCIGQGGFGVTYIGFDRTMGRRICIKEYFPGGGALRNTSRSDTVIWGSSRSAQETKQARESFVREARKAVKLHRFDTIVSVWDVFFANETAYIVMDYIDGVTIKSRMEKENRTFGEEECIRMLAPILRDLEQVHAQGIIHRDISPDNIMLRENRDLVLLDLGGAKDLSTEQGQSRFVVAKDGFTPMEQYSQQGKIGPWTDVYAMCATIYYCVTGVRLPTPMERLMGAQADMSAFSPAVAQVLERGLSIAPEKRIQTMGELYAALVKEEQDPPAPRRRPVWPRLLAGCLAALAVGAGALVLLRHVPAPTPVPTVSAAPDGETLFYRGLALEQEEEYGAAAEAYREAAALGSDEAMARLGSLYYRGAGTEQNYGEALSWFRKAEERGNRQVLFYIGTMYEAGLGVPRDREKAKEYYGRAAEDSEQARARLEVLSLLPDREYLAGKWGETEAIHNGTTMAYYLASPCFGRSGLTMSLRIDSYTGYPFGEWYLYAMDMDDNWEHIAQFRIEPEQADGRTCEYELHFDSPQSFQALSICPAEKGMEFSMERVILFHA